MLLIAGQLDPTFGAGGKVLTDFMGVVNAYGSRAAIQNDGKIVVTGRGGGPHFFVARYTVNGSLDSTFGSGGQILPDLSTEVVSVAIQADGKIVVSGTNDTGSGSGSASAVFFVERFNSDGSLDPTFGTGGKVSAGIGNLSIALRARPSSRREDRGRGKR